MSYSGSSSPSNESGNSDNNYSIVSICSNDSHISNSSLKDCGRVSFVSSFTNTSERFTCIGHAEDTLNEMYKYYQQSKLCDITLIAGQDGKRILTHKLVLASISDYFAAMFTGSLSNNEEKEITLTNVDGEILEAIVIYGYTGTLEIREDNVESLLSTAYLMLLQEVVEACSRFLARQLHPSNCLGIAIFADHQSCQSLLAEATTYVTDNFMEVVMNQEFLHLTENQLYNLLSIEDLNVTSEEKVFSALMTWLQQDADNRKQHLAKLLSLVKLSQLSPEFLTDFVESAIGNDVTCLKLLLEALKWHLLPERSFQLASTKTRPRNSTIGRLMVIGGMDSSKGAVCIETYDPRKDTWTVSHHLSGRRLQFGLALMYDKIIIVGGRDGLKTLNTMECLDLETASWSNLTPMNTHRHGLGVTVLGGSLYAVGGHDGWSYLNTVERWEPASRTWQYVAPMQQQRCSAGVAALNGRIYAAGGRDGSNCLRTVECYDPHTNKWTLVAPLARRKGCVGIAAANGYLYVMGGQDAPANNPSASRFKCVERYDPITDTWKNVCSFAEPRDAVACVQYGDKIFAAGGYDGSSYMRNVEAYDPIADKWINLKPLKNGRAGACAIVVANNVFEKNQEKKKGNKVKLFSFKMNN